MANLAHIVFLRKAKGILARNTANKVFTDMDVHSYWVVGNSLLYWMIYYIKGWTHRRYPLSATKHLYNQNAPIASSTATVEHYTQKIILKLRSSGIAWGLIRISGPTSTSWAKICI